MSATAVWFDVKDWHTSVTCNVKKRHHQDGFNCANYMEYKHRNHPFCCRAMHKTMYLSFWLCGAVNDTVLNSLNSVDFCYSLDPTQSYASYIATIPLWQKMRTSQSSTTAHHAGAMLIKPMRAVADTGVTSVFIMDGIPTKNKQLAAHSFQINLPDRRRVTSSHICNKTILGLPICRRLIILCTVQEYFWRARQGPMLYVWRGQTIKARFPKRQGKDSPRHCLNAGLLVLMQDWAFLHRCSVLDRPNT